eukprot:3672128-Rhodomonas_salina.3
MSASDTYRSRFMACQVVCCTRKMLSTQTYSRSRVKGRGSGVEDLGCGDYDLESTVQDLGSVRRGLGSMFESLGSIVWTRVVI